MIIGIGTDIIDIRRIEDTIMRFGKRFKDKCFLKSEIIRSESKKNTIQSYAKRYAAKEACAKALGTGLAQGVYWKDIEIKNNKFGKPYIILHKKAKFYINKFNNKNCKIELTISDEKEYAIANVIIFQ